MEHHPHIHKAETDRTNTELRQIETLLGVIDRSRLSGAEADIFNTLFPPEMSARPFRLESVQQHRLAEYTPEEKKASNYVLNLFGFTSSKNRTYKGHEDMPGLRIAYNGNAGAPLTHLNQLPCMAVLEDTGQTDPRLPDVADKPNAPRIKMTRKEHSKHLASMVVRDIVRMAIKTPDLFLQRVTDDMGRYKVGDGATIPDMMRGTYYMRMLSNKKGLDLSDEQMHALAAGMEYAKYLALYAYLHDERTPAWGDMIMKASKRFPGQKKVDYSEDETLAQDILSMANDPETGIPQFLHQFHMDTTFFVQLTQSLASENDAGLGGILMKSKRKGGFIEKGGPPELASQQSFDEDQVSGTIANMKDLAEKILPGGFGYMHKLRSDVPSEHARPRLQPIGSFHDRLQLLMYALSTGMTKDALTSFCKRHGIPPERVFIAAEEFQIGPNFLLSRTPTQNSEILPVSLDPGSLKRVMEAFAALTYFHYQNDKRSATETLVQDILTTIHAYQSTKAGTNIQPIHHTSNRTQILNFALQRSDYAFSQILSEQVPVLPYILRGLFSSGRRVNETEFLAHVEQADRAGKPYLASRAKIHPLARKNCKPGSLTLNHHGQIMTYLDVISNRLIPETGETENNPQSLPSRLTMTETSLSSQPYYYLFELEQEQLSTLAQHINAMFPPQYRDLIKKAIRYWTLDLKAGNHIIENPLSHDPRLALSGEDQSVGLMQQFDLHNADLLDLMHAQNEELSGSDTI